MQVLQKSAQSARKEILTDVPTEALDEVMNDFKSEGAKVEVSQEKNGNWTITAFFEK